MGIDDDDDNDDNNDDDDDCIQLTPRSSSSSPPPSRPLPLVFLFNFVVSFLNFISFLPFIITTTMDAGSTNHKHPRVFPSPSIVFVSIVNSIQRYVDSESQQTRNKTNNNHHHHRSRSYPVDPAACPHDTVGCRRPDWRRIDPLGTR